MSGLFKIRHFVLGVSFSLALFFYLNPALALKKNPLCLPHKLMLKFMFEVKRQGVLLGAVSDRGVAIQMFINPRTGEYTLLAITAEGMACIIDSGEHLRLAFERKA